MMSIALWLVILAIHSIQARPNYSSKYGSLEALAQGQYTIPLFDPNPSERAQEIKRNRAGYLYGPPLIGKSSFSLTGTLGDKKVADDLALWKVDAAPIGEAVAKEAPLAAGAVAAVSSDSILELGSKYHSHVHSLEA